MAPAVTVDLFKSRVLPYVRSRACPHPTNYVLDDAGERGDAVGPYGKSLLYLVSNAFERRRDTPLLGMERYVRGAYGCDRCAAGSGPRSDPEHDVAARAIISCRRTHRGFDNDPGTMNSVLCRIIGARPDRPFTADDLRY